MVMFIRLAAVATIAAASILATRPASASIQFCNHHNETVYVSVGLDDNGSACPYGDWFRGWYPIATNGCATVSNADVKNLPDGAGFFFRAQNYTGSIVWDTGNNGTPPAQDTFCTSNATYGYCTTNETQNCIWEGSPPGYYGAPWANWWVGNYDNFTMTLN
jgi:hypothetical protein